MKVTEVMVTSVRFLNANQSLLIAARTMKRFNIGCVLIGSEGHVAGVLTDRDVVLRGVASGEDLATFTIAEVMTPDPVFCLVEDTTEQAVKIMLANHVRRLPVLNDDRTVAGIVSISDISNHVSHKEVGGLIDTTANPRHLVTF